MLNRSCDTENGTFSAESKWAAARSVTEHNGAHGRALEQLVVTTELAPVYHKAQSSPLRSSTTYAALGIPRGVSGELLPGEILWVIGPGR